MRQILGIVKACLIKSEITYRYYLTFDMEGGEKNNVFQLTDIAGPRMEFESLDCRGIKPFLRLLSLSGIL